MKKRVISKSASTSSLDIFTFTTTGAPSTVVLIDDAGVAANAEAALLEVAPALALALVLAAVVGALDDSEWVGFEAEPVASVIVVSSLLTDDRVCIFSNSA